jgi:hypothetical protein
MNTAIINEDAGSPGDPALVPRTFKPLGERVADRWRRCHYDEGAFPDLAVEALAEADVARHLGARDVFAWGATASDLPSQLDLASHFGEPPLTVFSHTRFVIDVYTWFSSTTAIHQHGFCGAFYVLEGGSVQSSYVFHPDVKVSSRICLGSLELEGVRLLSQRDLVPIRSGSGFIHALFHLQHPSLTVVLRTRDDPGASPQYTYAPPTVAYDPFFEPPALRRRLESLAALLKLSPAAYGSAAERALERSDLFEAFALLRHAQTILRGGDQSLLARLRGKACAVHGLLGERVLPALDGIERKALINKMRERVTDAEHRFFLALLLNVPTGTEILRLVKERHPERPPEETVMSWVGALAAQNKLGMKLDGVQLDVFRLLLGGHGVPALVDLLKRDYDEADVVSATDKIDSFCRQLRAQPLFSTLFA